MDIWAICASYRALLTTAYHKRTRLYRARPVTIDYFRIVHTDITR